MKPESMTTVEELLVELVRRNTAAYEQLAARVDRIEDKVVDSKAANTSTLSSIHATLTEIEKDVSGINSGQVSCQSVLGVIKEHTDTVEKTVDKLWLKVVLAGSLVSGVSFTLGFILTHL